MCMADRLITALCVLALALVLGWAGPALDAQPDRRAEWPQANAQLHASGELARLEADARQRCAQWISAEGAIHVDGGTIVCADKRGRRQHTLASPVTAAELAQLRLAAAGARP